MGRFLGLKTLSLFTLLMLGLAYPGLVEAEGSCSSHRFEIEDELTGEILGDISTAFLVRGNPSKVICLEGRFDGKEYRYEYYCNGDYSGWEFVRKIANDEYGRSCFRGVIR